MRTPGSLQTSSVLALFDLAAKHRALLNHGVQHARQAHIDPKDRLAGHDGAVVHAGLGLADNAEVLRGSFSFTDFRIGRGEALRPWRPVRRNSSSFVRRPVHHLAAVGGAFGFGHAPRLRGRGDQHLAVGGPTRRSGSQFIGVDMLPPANCAAE